MSGTEAEEQPLELEPEPEPSQEASEQADAEKKAEAENVLRPDLPEPTEGGAPPWVKIPEGFKFPRGIQVVFVKLRADLTARPEKGDRQAILWALSEADEKAAYNRSMQDPNRAPGQLAKQMIRAIDGHTVDWSGSPDHPGNIDKFWNEMGGKYRSQMIRLWNRLHVLSEDEQRDFFEHCIAVRSTG